MSQKQSFLNGEADNWSKRNLPTVDVNSLRGNITFLNNFIKDGDQILEIGCSFGGNIKTVAQEKNVNYFGIDPSTEAIMLARDFFPKYKFTVGTADELKFNDSYFDVIYFGFCLYLVDRKDLMKVAYEADRVLKPGGLLFITDFSPKKPTKRAYAHLEGVFSYKMNYENLFLSSPAYSLISKKTHLVDGEIPNEENRVSTVVLKKEIDPYSLV